jgi:AcrR family transcriptional regulator
VSLPRRRPRTATDDRRAALLAAAADLVWRKGYAGASMREIAAEAGVLISTVYHYFPSKEDLIEEVHRQGVERITGLVEAALAGRTDPWERLEAAVVAHVEAILPPDPFCRAVQAVLPGRSAEFDRRLIAQRDAYEAVLMGLLDDLPVRPGVDRRLFRLGLVGMVNAIPRWYRPGRLSAEQIASGLVAMLRDGVSAAGAGGP